MGTWVYVFCTPCRSRTYTSLRQWFLRPPWLPIPAKGYLILQRRWDSNSRDSFPSGAFQEHCTKPLCDSSMFPTLRLRMSSHIGFLFLKNLLGIPVKNSQDYDGGDSHHPLFQRCPTRAVDILRNHSLGLDSKTVEYLLLIIVINPLIDVLGHYHHLFFLKKCFLPWLSPMYSII